MEPIFTEEQLNKMSRENIIALVTAMQKHRQKQEDQIRILQEKTKELEFLNAMLSDRLTLAQRKRFGASSEKYADGYEQLNLFNEAEQAAEVVAPASTPAPIVARKGFQGFATDAVHMPVGMDEVYPFRTFVWPGGAVKAVVYARIGLVEQRDEVVFYDSFLFHKKSELLVPVFIWLRILSIRPYCLRSAHWSRA